MKYSVNYEDLYGHNNVIDVFDTLEEAKQEFIFWCWTPPQEFDDFLELCICDDEGNFTDWIEDYEYLRLDRDERYNLTVADTSSYNRRASVIL